MLRWTEKILNNLFLGITILLAGMLLMRLLGYSACVTASDCMEPEIETGAVLVVKNRYEYSDIREGDVIVYRTGEEKVACRVLDVTGSGCETKGDANAVSDGITTTAENFEGKVITSMPKGCLLGGLFTGNGKILMLVCAAGICIANGIIGRAVNGKFLSVKKKS